MLDIVVRESDMGVAPSCKKLLEVALMKRLKKSEGKGNAAKKSLYHKLFVGDM